MSSHRRIRDRREPDTETLLRLAERGDLIDNPQVQQLVSTAAVTDNTHLKREIEKALTVKATQRQTQPFDTNSIPTSTLDEQLTLGATLTGSSYNLVQDDLTQHLLSVGQSGAGKTTLFYNLMEQIDVPFWAFDLKQDYRHLIQVDGLDLLVLPWAELKFNPLKPPEGVPPRRWTQVFSEIFGHATALLSGSKNYLMKAVIELYQLYDLFDDVSPPYPSLHELRLLAEREKINYVRTSSDYRDRILNRVEAMTLTAGSIFDCSQGYPIENLMERNVIFEFDGLATDLQNFLMEILFAYVYEYRVAHNQRDGILRHVFFLDEGKRVFSVYKERQDAAGIPAIDQLTAQMREFGEGLLVADQEASKLTDSIKANTYTKVLLATGDAKQFQDIATTMHLSDRQRELARQVGVGEAIIQTGNRDPVPVRLDPYDVEKTITDDELRRRQDHQWERLEWTDRGTTAAFEAVVQRAGTPGEDGTPDAPDSEIDLSEEADRFLKDVVKNPFTPLTERYDQCSSIGKGNQIKNTLVEAGLIREQQVTAGDHTRKLLELTDAGREYAADQGYDVEHRGRGGIVHRYWQHRIKEVFEAVGWPAKRELFNADVYVNMGDTELVVEVAMGDNTREVEHVKQHLDTGFDAVWLVCPTADIRDALRERLAENDLLDESVVFHLFQDILRAEQESLEQFTDFTPGKKEEENVN